MNVAIDQLDYYHFLYGRETEKEHLQLILKSTLAFNNATSSADDGCCNIDTTNDITSTAVSSRQQCQQTDKLCYISIGSLHTTKTDNTSATVLSDENQTTSAVAPTNEAAHSNQACCIYESRCQFVLIQGPLGSGKHSFIRGTINQLKYSTNCDCSNDSKTLESDSSLLQGPLYNDVSTAQSQLLPFITVEGRFRRYESSTTNKRNRLDGKEIPLIAFDDAVAEMFFIIQNNKAMLETIRKQLVETFNNPVDDLHILCETYPFMKSWLHMDTSVTPISSDDTAVDGRRNAPPLHGKSEVVISTRATLRQEHFILHDAQLRSPLIVQFFLGVAHCIPVVLVLRDMHYADVESIALLEKLFHNDQLIHESKGLLVVATCQSEDTSNQSISFRSFLDRCNLVVGSTEERIGRKDPVQSHGMDQNEVSVSEPTTYKEIPCHNIYIKDYSLDNVLEWVQDCDGYIEKCSIDQKSDLASFVLQKSMGKPFHVGYLLQYLEQNESILVEKDLSVVLPDDVVVTYETIIMRQDSLVQAMLKIVAALTHEYDGQVSCIEIEMLMNQSCIDTMKIAAKHGLVKFESAMRCVAFCQEEIQTAAYNLIPTPDRPGFHIDIGRRIWQTLSSSELNEEKSDPEVISRLLLVVSQLRNHVDLLNDLNECYLMSRSCYETGTIASSFGDYDSATKLFDFAIRVLGTRVWQGELYETSLVLHNSLAQAYCCLGVDVRVDTVLDEIFDKARTFDDRLSANLTLLASQAQIHNQQSAFRIASDTLHKLGETINENPSLLSIAMSFLRTKRLVQSKTLTELANLPDAASERIIAVELFLLHASTYSYIIKAEIGILVIFRSVRLSIEEGVSGASAAAFALYALILSASGSFEEGNRMGQVALLLADRFESWKPRVISLLYGYTRQWSYPVRDCLLPLYRSAQTALVSGDSETFAASSGFFAIASLSSGTSLFKVEVISRSLCESIISFGQTNPSLFVLPLWELVANLVCNEEKLNVNNPVSDGESAFRHALKENNSYCLGNLYMLRTMWCYLIGDYEQAIIAAKKSHQHRPMLDYSLLFYEGLSVLAAARVSRSCAPCQYRNRGKSIAKRMKSFANRCPANFLNKYYLLEAELRALNGRTELAIQRYRQSIEKSIEIGMVHEEGIAYERLGQFHLHLGNDNDAKKHLSSARTAFEKWGAIKLVQRMDSLLAKMA